MVRDDSWFAIRCYNRCDCLFRSDWKKLAADAALRLDDGDEW